MSSVMVKDILKKFENLEWLQLSIDGKLLIDEVNDGSNSAEEYKQKMARVLIQYSHDFVKEVKIEVIEQHHYSIKITLEKEDNSDEILPF